MPIAVLDRPGFRLKARASKAAQRFAAYRIDESDARGLAGLVPPAWTILTHAAVAFVVDRAAPNEVAKRSSRKPKREEGEEARSKSKKKVESDTRAIERRRRPDYV